MKLKLVFVLTLLLISNSYLKTISKEYKINKLFKSVDERLDEVQVNDVIVITFKGDYIYSRPQLENFQSIKGNININRNTFQSKNDITDNWKTTLISESRFEIKCINAGEVVLKFKIPIGNDIFSSQSFF